MNQRNCLLLMFEITSILITLLLTDIKFLLSLITSYQCMQRDLRNFRKPSIRAMKYFQHSRKKWIRFVKGSFIHTNITRHFQAPIVWHHLHKKYITPPGEANQWVGRGGDANFQCGDGVKNLLIPRCRNTLMLHSGRSQYSGATSG